MSNSRFYIIVGVVVAAIIIFALPGAHQTIQTIRKEPGTIDAPIKIFEETLTWNSGDKPALTVDWNGICCSLNTPAKDNGPERRRFYLGAVLTNKSEKPMKVTSLECKFAMDGVELSSQTMITSLNGATIAPGEQETLSSSTFLDRDIIVGIFERSIRLSASARFTFDQ